MALTLGRLRTISSYIGLTSLSRGIFTTASRGDYVYNDPQYKTISSTNRFKQKHYVPKFKKDRARKFMKVDLPDKFERDDKLEMTPDENRAKMKERGIQPVRPWMEKPIFVSSTNGTFEPYIPPEGDGIISVASPKGITQKFKLFEKKGKSMIAVRKLRQFDEEFDRHEFADQALQIYIDTHKALADMDKDKLHQLVTERLYPIIIHDTRNKTLRWQFIRSLEPPRVVHARTTDVITKENIFAQITVRFHTKQTLAVYDRFGRLIHGSEVVARDVLEYVVFEKHVANTYGIWRLHDKIIPDWIPPLQPIRKTYKIPAEAEEEDTSDEEEGEKQVKKEGEKQVKKEGEKQVKEEEKQVKEGGEKQVTVA